jgi:hypothetical protein
MNGMMHEQDGQGDKMPCKGMLPGCVTDLGCIFPREVGLGRVAGGAIGGEVVLPRLDVVLGLTARAVEPFIEMLVAAAFEVGDQSSPL